MLRLPHRLLLAIEGKSRNLTSLSNLMSKADTLENGDSREGGVPRLDRQDVKGIIMLHDSDDLVIAGRNKSSHFNTNQYFIGSKKAKEGMFVGACDDWPDDWAVFTSELEMEVRQLFLTHCHVDDMVNLPFFWEIWPRLMVHWCISETPWVERFKESCIRYGRLESAKATLPMHNYALGCSNPLSSDTNRSSSFLQVGDIPCYYIHTPGHSPGHMLLHLPLHRVLFTGDLLYKDSIGRVDLPFATGDHMAQSLRVLEEMPDSTVIMPCHGKLSTLGRERRANPALSRLYEFIASGKTLPRVGTNSGFL